MSAPRLKVVLVGVNAPRYRSLGLAYVRAYATLDPRLSGVAFTTLDLDTDLDAWWIAYRILALDPDVVAFSVMCWNARAVAEACRLVRAAKPESIIVLGGPEVGPIAEPVLAEQPAVDIVVRGEGKLCSPTSSTRCFQGAIRAVSRASPPAEASASSRLRTARSSPISTACRRPTSPAS